jgi:uncharacterized membrane protein YedE/YeeE
MPSASLISLAGGALIGLAATWYWLITGRVAGVSGIVRGTLREAAGRRDGLAFLAGLAVAGLAASMVGQAPAAALTRPLAPLLLAGVLVGFGTRMGGGCTSGHGVCGLSRLSVRSLVATLTFMAVAAVTVFVVGHFFPGTVPR